MAIFMSCFPCAFEKMYELGWKNRRLFLCIPRFLMARVFSYAEDNGGMNAIVRRPTGFH